ncbi:glycosyltransferase family 1 protein [Annulohypoxylon moriforme]|nr:glycosyltransferase family 1 protein [Annulohypoxylon moriforme]
MDTQPQPSREGQGEPQNERDENLTNLSSTSLPQDDTELPLPLTPTEEAPDSPFDDDPFSQPLPSVLNEDHRRCLAEMENFRSAIDPPPLNLMNILHFFYNISYLIVVFLSPVSLQVWIAIFTGLFLKSWLWGVSAIVVFLIIRHMLVIAVRRSNSPTHGAWPEKMRTPLPHYILIVCGSGGHTGEMIRMVDRGIRPRNELSHRRWAIGYGDRMSLDKVMKFEYALSLKFGQTQSAGTFDIAFFLRPRAVHQSWLTTPFTALVSLVDMLKIMTTAPDHRTEVQFRCPGVVATDGPGAGFMFLLAAHWIKMIFVVPSGFLKTIFVESWARVNSLSLSGKLIKHFTLADVFIVQYKGIIHRPSPNEYYNSNFVAMPGRHTRVSKPRTVKNHPQTS